MNPTKQNDNNNSVNYYLPRFYAIRSALWSLIHRIAATVNQLFESIRKKLVLTPAPTSQKEFTATPVAGNSKVDEAIENMENSPIPPASKPEPKTEPEPQPVPTPQPPVEPQQVAENQEELIRKRQELALRIANEKIPLEDLNLSEDELLELAPYLTYLDLSGPRFTYKSIFIAKLLEKTEQLNHLLINSHFFGGDEFDKFKNVKQLKTLEIHNSHFFNWPLPEGMESLQKLVITNCPRYNRPFPKGMGALQSLEVSFCPLFDQPLLKNMMALKSLTITCCDNFRNRLPSNMDALENLEIIGCNYPHPIPESMPALKTITLPSPSSSLSYWTPLLEIYFIDRERGLRFVSEVLGRNEKALLCELFGRKDYDETEKIQRLLERISPQLLGDLIRRKDIPFVHDTILEKDPVQQLYIYIIYSKIQPNSANAAEQMDLLKVFLTPIVMTPINEDLIVLYETMCALLQDDFKREILLTNLKNLTKSGLFAPFQILAQGAELVDTLSSEPLFTGNLEEDRKTYYRMLADKIAKKEIPLKDAALVDILSSEPLFTWNLEEDRKTFFRILADKIAIKKIPLNSLSLSESEILELAPYLTDLRLVHAPYTEEFFGTLLEKTEQLSVLVIDDPDFKGETFGKFKNVEHLKSLCISAPNFQSPLPEGMEALQELAIVSNLYTSPFPKGMGNLQKLTLKNCTYFNQPFPEQMDALKTLVMYNCNTFKKPLPRKLDALELLIIQGGNLDTQDFPRSMTFLKTLECNAWNKSIGLIPAISGIYKIDRARGLKLSAQLGIKEKDLLLHLFGGENSTENKKILELIDKITPEVLLNLIRREHFPFLLTRTENVRFLYNLDTLHQLYIYNIYSKVQANSANLVEDTKLFSRVIARCVRSPLDDNLTNFYAWIDKTKYSDLIPLLQCIVANKDLESLNTEKRVQLLAYMCSGSQEVLLCNLINLEKSGLFNTFRKVIPSTDAAVLNGNSNYFNSVSNQKLFNGNSDSDRKTFYQMLADKIANERTSLLSLHLSEEEMFELAPYLTYVDLSESTNKLDKHWIPDDRVDDFMGRLLEKTEQLRVLRIESIMFDGSALARIKNVEQLERLEFRHCPIFNHPLPAGLDSLRSLTIRDCNAFNQPLTVNVAQLNRLLVKDCKFLKSNSILNSIMPIFKSDRERGLKLAEPLVFDEDFLQNYSEIWSEGHEPDSDTYYRLVAKYIADKKIPIQKFDFSKDELLALAPHLTYLDLPKYDITFNEEFIHELLKKTEKLEHLIIRDMTRPLPRFNTGNLHTLEVMDCFTFDDTLPEDMSALRKLVIAQGLRFNKPLPKGMVALESLHFLECDEYNQPLPADLSALKELSFDNCPKYNQPFPQVMTALESIVINDCRSFNRATLLPIILSIYEMDHDRGITLADSLGLFDQLGPYINFCESDDDDMVATSLITLMRPDFTFPPSALNKFEEFIRRDAGRGGRFVQRQRNDLLRHPQLCEKLFSVYPLDKPENFALFNTVKLEDNILYLTLLPKAALDFPDALFKKIKLLLLGDERVDRLSVKFHGSPGIDGGGLSRQLVTQFIQGLLNNSKMFKFEATDNGKVIPQATTSLTDEDLINYMAFGIFLGIAYRQKNPTGEVFSEKWLQCIFSLKENLDGEISQFLDGMNHSALKIFMEGCVEHNEQRLKSYGTVLTSQDESEVLATAVALDPDLEDDSLDIEEVRNIVRKDWIAPNVMTYLRMVQAMVLGMKKALSVFNHQTGRTYWEDLSRMITEDFSLRLQGRLSADWIKRNISFTPENSPKALEVKAWLEEWLENHKDNYQSLANFVQTLTGARALLAPVTVNIRSGVASVYPHTCSSEVDVPDNIEKDVFILILDDYGNGKDLAFTRM